MVRQLNIDRQIDMLEKSRYLKFLSQLKFVLRGGVKN